METGVTSAFYPLRRPYEGVLGASVVGVQLLVRPLIRPGLHRNALAQEERQNSGAVRSGRNGLSTRRFYPRSELAAQLVSGGEELLRRLLKLGGSSAGVGEPLYRGLRGAVVERPGCLEPAEPTGQYVIL